MTQQVTKNVLGVMKVKIHQSLEHIKNIVRNVRINKHTKVVKMFNMKTNHGWDIDHIIPLSSAKSEEEIIKLCFYTNLQPLCSYTNRYIKRDIVQESSKND